jgi:His/Glu/Gln/Arg/opine family amino acid ABC transporter permease subunit
MMNELIDQLSNLSFYLIGSYPKGELGGLLLNITMAFLAIAISFVFGVLLGYSRLSCRKYIKLPCVAYIEIVRSTPLIMIIFWIYFFGPYILGEHVTVFSSAVASLCIYAAAYQAEIVRAGILAIPKGQMEAGLTLGLSRVKTLRHIILPQAFRIMIPSFVSFFVSLFKDTSTTYIIGVIELTQTGIIISQRQPDKIYATYICMGIGFWVICFSMSRVARRLEKRIGVYDLESIRPDACRDDYMLLPTHKVSTEKEELSEECPLPEEPPKSG